MNVPVSAVPKISIVTPSYNQAEFLEQTISSVLNQNYANLEYVVIDAASTDGSVDIIREQAERLTYWVSEPDKGHADGLNKGFTHTNGEIMGWINSSDVHYPWTLQTVAQVFTDVPEAKWITGVPTHLADGMAPQNINPVYRNVYDFLSGDYCWLQQESIFWRRSLWDAAGGHLDTSLKSACDFEQWLRFFQLAPLYHVNTILAGFRYHDDRLGGLANDPYRDEAKRCFEKFDASFGPRERFRAKLVRMTNRVPGRGLSGGLHKSGLWRWYQHPQITYDFTARHWNAK